MLRSRGFEAGDIKQLVSSKNKASEPARANILQSLQDLAKSTKKDDFVYLHFASHGSLYHKADLVCLASKPCRRI